MSRKEVDQALEDLVRELVPEIFGRHYGKNGSLDADVSAMISDAFYECNGRIIKGLGYDQSPYYYSQLLECEGIGKVKFLMTSYGVAFVNTPGNVPIAVPLASLSADLEGGSEPNANFWPFGPPQGSA